MYKKLLVGVGLSSFLVITACEQGVEVDENGENDFGELSGEELYNYGGNSFKDRDLYELMGEQVGRSVLSKAVLDHLIEENAEITEEEIERKIDVLGRDLGIDNVREHLDKLGITEDELLDEVTTQLGLRHLMREIVMEEEGWSAEDLEEVREGFTHAYSGYLFDVESEEEKEDVVNWLKEGVSGEEIVSNLGYGERDYEREGFVRGYVDDELVDLAESLGDGEIGYYGEDVYTIFKKTETVVLTEDQVDDVVEDVVLFGTAESFEETFQRIVDFYGLELSEDAERILGLGDEGDGIEMDDVVE